MRVLFVTSSLTGGGAERVLSVLANSFCEDATIEKVSIVSIIEDKVTYEINPNVQYYAFNSKYNGKIDRVWKRFRFLRAITKNEEPDIIISFATQINLYAIFAKLGLSTKLIISERNDPNNDPVQPSVRKLRDIFYRFCNGAVFQTEDAKKYFEHIIRGNKTVILNPIKDDLPTPYTGKRDKRIVTVARLHPAKNLPMLINAFASISTLYPEFKLEIYGDGAEKSSLIELSKDKGILEKVIFKGFSQNIHEDINSAMCFVLPSNYEGMSNAMLESLALGIPTICTDCPIGGARMVIRHLENGLLVPVGDEQGLTELMKLVIDNEKLRDTLAENSVKIREELSAGVISNQWMQFISKDTLS